MIYNKKGVPCILPCKILLLFKVRRIVSDFYISNMQDEDEIEIIDLEPQDNGSSASFPFVLLKLARKVPLFASSRSRFTMLAWLTCFCLLLFTVQPTLPDVPRQTRIASAQDSQYLPAIISTTSAHGVTRVRIANGQIIVIRAAPGRIVWHQCKVQRWFAPPKYAHPTVVVCT